MKNLFQKILKISRRHIRAIAIAVILVGIVSGLFMGGHVPVSRMYDYVNTVFTFNDSKEIQLRLGSTEKYAQEIVLFSEQEKWENLREALMQYDTQISAVEKIVTESDDTSTAEMLLFIASSTASHTSIFKDTVSKIPKEMKFTLLRLIEKNIDTLAALQEQYQASEKSMAEFEDRILGNVEEESADEMETDGEPKKEIAEAMQKAPLSKPVAPKAVLAITNVTESVSGQVVTISWQTGADARSHIEMNEQSFDSVEDVSKNHTVVISNLTKGKTYSYKIIAKSLGSSASEDTVNDTFETAPVYTIEVAISDDSSCYLLTVSDNEEYLVRGYQMNITGRITTGNVLYPQKSYTTDKNGEVEYCNKGVTHFSIESKDIDYVASSNSVAVYNRTLKNLTTNRTDEYGLFQATFDVYK
ncbi:hypothetical protein A3C89_00290 [Candidatus Kaiserbacteria bacterium RIFCSPHIGHO2_02_FULL_50_50]|uniref:Fibronectin type-III domain-containing protein n=1 Tax=Candidatus Kaiserbacteria bacterium RIFCSPHIGHO2_02_FULL_50_50 TaxID=1798492 RepID=A0A1F6DE28_9BACT|nr:MAG: hypothetical protein A3C89_00290 [Candidatus Kaiserbacteria bacterium RIFCSPHIGHO2_02_FULL_50_50]